MPLVAFESKIPVFEMVPALDRATTVIVRKLE
jgi:hypothetical protein